MAFVQTTYTENQPIGQVGALVDSTEWNADTLIAGGNIPFAAPLIRTGDTTCTIAAEDSTAPFAGLAKRDITLVHTTPDRYEQYDNVTALTAGKLWGIAGATVTAGAKAQYDVPTGEWVLTGGYDAPGVFFDSSAVDGGLVKLRVAPVGSQGPAGADA